MADKRYQYQVEHVTHYDYGAPVVHAHHLLHLTPRDHAWQTTHRHELDIAPASGHVHHDFDSFGNQIARLELDHPHRQLVITARSQVEVIERSALDAKQTLSWERLRDSLSYHNRPRSPAELEAIGFLLESPHVRIKNVFSDFAEDCFPAGQPSLVCALALMHKIHRELTYTPGSTQINTSLLAVLESRRGVCQDYSHLMLACLRSLGLPARYVSGYLRTIPPADGRVLVGADASHAWVSVYVPPLGWVDLDPTNDVVVNTDHLTLSWGRDFSDVSPVRGVIVGGGTHEVRVAVTVKPLSSVAT